ncbi:hypothetical protein ACFQJ7_15740 [Halovenus rubra]|uniref:Tat (Twin-arginine translocation) pathway signal sequence n=2 Tax=Halovenus rubra TaxID=869890 RepID=A0ABD5X862_9EURY|nr:hypothetical protein [Halovenus rubra]
MVQQTRRRFIGGVATAGAIFSSGCLGLVGLGNDSSDFDSPESVVDMYIDLLPTLYGDTDKWLKEAQPVFHPQSTFLDGDDDAFDWFRRDNETTSVEETATNTVDKNLTESQIRSLDLTTGIQGPVQDLLSADTALVDASYSLKATEIESPNDLADNEMRFFVATDEDQWKIIGIVSNIQQ